MAASLALRERAEFRGSSIAGFTAASRIYILRREARAVLLAEIVAGKECRILPLPLQPLCTTLPVICRQSTAVFACKVGHVVAIAGRYTGCRRARGSLQLARTAVLLLRRRR